MSSAEGMVPPLAAPAVTMAEAPETTAVPRRRLFRKYALLFIGLVGAALLITSGFDFWFSYQETKAALLRLQQEKAIAAAERIEGFVEEIQRQIGWTTHAQWAASPLDQRRQDYFRLLRQVPAITEVRQLDAEGREQLKVSRLAMDAIGSAADFSQNPAFLGAKTDRVWFSPVYFRKQSEPYVTMALAHQGRNAGITIAEINLKLIWDVITDLKIGKSGYAYVVDGNGRLIAHPDISLVLRGTDLSGLPQVAAALAQTPGTGASGTGASGTDHRGDGAVVAENLAGRPVLSAHAPSSPLGWRVFVEAPLSEAFAPLYGAALRTGGLLILGLIAATLLALFLARRMTGPIHAIAEGAERFGAGEFGRRIEVHTGDELEALAGQFNRMAADLQKSYAELEQRVVERTAELSEALEQQTATAEVLGVINSSPGDLAPVFDAMLEKATRLCEAASGILWTYDGTHFWPAALHSVPPAFAEWLRDRTNPIGTASLSALAGGQNVVRDDDLIKNRGAEAAVELGGMRTGFLVALRKGDTLLGAIRIMRREVRPFSNKQIALVENFAAQAVIAMENARLIAETREALEQQTATAEVLQVINSSPGDLAPVFDAMLEKATRLAEAEFAMLNTYDGQQISPAAFHRVPPAYAELVSRMRRPSPGGAVTRIVNGEDVVHIEDVTARPDFNSGEVLAKGLFELGGVRSYVVVGMRKDTELLGTITVYRREARPFTEKQIALLQNFAAQAVIAMENARLLNELRERTDDLARSVEELTALSEVGQAVSATLDVGAVLSTILNRSVGLTGSDAGAIFRYRRRTRSFRLVEAVGWDAALTEQIGRLDIAEDVTGMGEATRRRVSLQVPDLERRAGNPLRDAALAAGYHAVLIMPLVGPDRVFGAIVLQRRAPGEFPEAAVRLMQTIASQSVLAIQNARLFREIAEKSELLAEASRHKSQFLANMSHELRTPLNAILGYTELMADGIYGELQPRAAGVLERVQNNGRHLLALINDVLDLAKIEAGQLVFTLEDYSLADVVQSVVSATEGMARNKGLDLTAEIMPGLPAGHADARRLQQVLLNLVGNAVKFTDEGEVAIGAAAQGEKFVLTVRDTGPGIAPEDHGRIFEEFQQVDSSTTRKKGGTGLGLAISKQMIEMQGGAISVESELGNGATFRVVLPIRVEDIVEEAVGPAAIASAREASTELRGAA